VSPRAVSVAGVVLFPGASAGRGQSALVAMDKALSPVGIVVERVDFPYRVAGRRTPDRPEVLVSSVVSAATGLAAALGAPQDRIALGGRSMGGRVCSMAVADGLASAALVLVSYPLHPPGRPDRLRVEHFGRISVPCLFLSGTRDAFGSPAELEAATRDIPAAVTHQWVEGGDHSLRNRDAEVASAVCRWLEAL
jgi:uncharacterized protein